MKAWLYRWPNGDCSIVWAQNRIDALDVLDEVGPAEMRDLIPLQQGAVHFALVDDGELERESWSESLSDKIVEAYPVIEALRAKVFDERGSCEPDQTDMSIAVNAERERLKDQPTEPAKTERGRFLQKAMGMSGPLADHHVLVNTEGTKH